MSQDKDKKPRKPLWRRVLKWALVTLCVVVVLVVGVCSLAVWTLTPQRLTPLVERAGSKYLEADVAASRIELTFWHTFPKLTLDIDTLILTSRTLRNLDAEQRRQLPPDADSLLWLGTFHGGINLAKLAVGKIELYDVIFKGLRANLVQVNDTVSNFQIMKLEDDDEPLELPDISLRRFEIADAAPLRYRSLADGMDMTLNLQRIDLVDQKKAKTDSTIMGSKLPMYRLTVEGNGATPLLEAFNFQELTFEAEGSIGWDSGRPFAIELEELKLSVDQYRGELSAKIDFTDEPRVEKLRARLDDIDVPGLLSHAPAALAPYVRPLSTDMHISAQLELLRPWTLADTLMPTLRAEVEIPSCRLDYEQLRLREFQGRFAVDFDGENIDATTIDIQRLRLYGQSVDVELQAQVRRLLSDPWVDGTFRGSMNLAKLPAKLKAQLPVTLTGTATGDAHFRFAMSDLNRDNFHRLRASGQLTLRDIHATAEGMGAAYLGRAVLDFGTDKTLGHGDQRVDSLLQVTLAIDTLGAQALGMELEVKDLQASVGTLNRRQSADTAEINPFGGLIKIDRLRFKSQMDTMRLSLHRGRIYATLRRYEGGAHKPLVDLGINAGGIAAGTGLNSVMLREPHVSVTLHERVRKNRGDSTRRMRTNTAASDSAAIRLLALDAKDRKLLRNWDFSGTVRAARGRLRTPYFPLRNTLENVDLTFNQDSVQLRNLHYQAGSSDFIVNGSITNLRRALVSRHDNTLNIDLSLVSDTLNVNEIVHALYAGGTLTQEAAPLAELQADENADSEPDYMVMADTAAAGPLLVPQNINARLQARAAHVLYSDLEFDDLRGTLLVLGGAVNLRDFGARTDIGSLDLQALYSAPDTANMEFGMGMKVNDFRLDRLSQLIPAIDSLLPPIRNFAGIVNADVALTTDLYPNMDLDLPTLKAAIKLEGDSLVLLDPDMFKSLSKWLMFKNKKRNMIDHMAVEVMVENSAVELYPFLFDIDRYKLGVMGHNDLAMNLDYHISVLKSPIPWKFGINIKGNIDDMKIRLGGAKIKPGMTVERQSIADTTRVNLVQQIDNVFRRGVRNARMGRLKFQGRPARVDSVEEALPDSVLHQLQK